MQTKYKDGTVMVCGAAGRDAELQYVGEDQKRKCSVGLAVGKRPVEGEDKPETVWANVVAWHDAASVLAQAKKGTQVLAIGRLRTHTYNDKEYTDLVADFVWPCCLGAAIDTIAGAGPAPMAPADAGADEDDGELPF